MGGLLRFMLFFVALVGLLVLVGLPAVAAPVLTQMVRDAGLQADEMRVTIAYFDPGLIAGRTERLRIEASGVQLGRAHAGGLDLTLGGVQLLDRTFERVTGNVRDIDLSAGGLVVNVDRVDVDGPAAAARVAAHLTPGQSVDVVRQAAALLGVGLRDVQLRDGTIEVDLGGFRTSGSLSVRGGALVLEPQLGPALVLIQPAPTDPWRLTDARVSSDGVTIHGVVDAEVIARRVASGR